MEKAQDKVLQSLYGLGTDMTVTKAAAAAGELLGSGRASSSTRRTTAPTRSRAATASWCRASRPCPPRRSPRSTSRTGVADAVGGLSLQVIKVDGQFTRGQFQQNEDGRRPAGRRGRRRPASPQGEVQGGGADFDVNNYSVYGTDVTKPDLGPLTSSKITSGRTFTTSETNAEVAVVDSAYAKEKKLKVGSTVTIKASSSR